MAPTRQRTRASGHSSSPRANQTTVPTKAGTPTRTPRKKPGLTLAQKQALIDNLQLEITERARRLRAQYNLQAQGLRSRIEIRVNRIPISLRRMTVGDLLARNQPRSAATTTTTTEDHAPPVPAKDTPQRQASSYKPTYNGSSDELAGPDKENNRPDNTIKRTRAPNAPPRILSPASSNSRLPPARERPASPSKPSSHMQRPASPAKPAPRTGVLSGMVEKAKSVRGGTARKAAAASAASAAGTPGGATAARKRANTGASAGPGAGAARATARAGRRVSASSSVSTETASTAARKGAGAGARAPAKKVAGAPAAAAAKKAPVGGTTKKAAPGKAGATRVLRKRA